MTCLQSLCTPLPSLVGMMMEDGAPGCAQPNHHSDDHDGDDDGGDGGDGGDGLAIIIIISPLQLPHSGGVVQRAKPAGRPGPRSQAS